MAKKKKIIVGNWKMGPARLKDAVSNITTISKSAPRYKNVLTVICPPNIYIQKTVELVKKKVAVGAQNLFEELEGSYTGEVSAPMLKNSGATYVIVGHSERRKLGETDEVVNKKVLLALGAGLIPIICIGEEVRDENGDYLALLKSQLRHALAGIQKKNLGSVIIAYEPVWAIGATEAMDATSIHETMLFIKKALIDMYKVKPPVPTPILYGGAVDPTNTKGILIDGEADGLLIGRQSLVAENFVEIIKTANTK